LQGIADAVRHYTVFGTIGFYAVRSQWNEIVGNWQPADAAWIASVSNNDTVAAAYCKKASFTNGSIVMAQYTKTLDRNRAC